MGYNNPHAQQIHQRVTEIIALDSQPFSMVDDPGFTRLVCELEPRYSLPSRKNKNNFTLASLVTLLCNLLNHACTCIHFCTCMYCQIVYEVQQLNQIGYRYRPISAMNNRLSEYRLKSLIGATLLGTEAIVVVTGEVS